jgi:hypothetical protein
MKRSVLLLLSLCVSALTACVAPGIQGPGGSVQGTANVEALERQDPVTPAPDTNRGWGGYGYGYGYGPYYYGRCGGGPCNRGRYYY